MSIFSSCEVLIMYLSVLGVAFNFFPFQVLLQTDQRKFKQRNTNFDQTNWPIYYLLVQSFRPYWFIFWSIQYCRLKCIYRCHIVNWRINKLLLPHNLYSAAKHFPLSSQRPFHFHCSVGTLFYSD